MQILSLKGYTTKTISAAKLQYFFDIRKFSIHFFTFFSNYFNFCTKYVSYICIKMYTCSNYSLFVA